LASSRDRDDQAASRRWLTAVVLGAWASSGQAARRPLTAIRRERKGPALRRLINSTYISLDGEIEHPQKWPSVGDRGNRGDEIQTELALSCDVLIMSRRTYEGFAPVWPTRSGDGVSDQVNPMPKMSQHEKIGIGRRMSLSSAS
jgi:hypothetical protein